MQREDRIVTVFRWIRQIPFLVWFWKIFKGRVYLVVDGHGIPIPIPLWLAARLTNSRGIGSVKLKATKIRT